MRTKILKDSIPKVLFGSLVTNQYFYRVVYPEVVYCKYSQNSAGFGNAWRLEDNRLITISDLDECVKLLPQNTLEFKEV